MKIYLTKTQSGFVPSDIETEEWAKKIKYGAVISSDFKKVRNPAFHRKYMALLTVAFDNWTPGEVDPKHGVPEKNFDRFRKDVAILSGFYHNVVRLDGTVRVEADSISFANMTEEIFAELYNQSINVLLKRVYKSELSKEELDNIVNNYMSFT